MGLAIVSCTFYDLKFTLSEHGSYVRQIFCQISFIKVVFSDIIFTEYVLLFLVIEKTTLNTSKYIFNNYIIYISKYFNICFLTEKNPVKWKMSRAIVNTAAITGGTAR